MNGYFSRDKFSFNRNVSYQYQNINTSVRYRSIVSDRTDMVISGRMTNTITIPWIPPMREWAMIWHSPCNRPV